MRPVPLRHSLSGPELEWFVAALYHANGYYVLTDLLYKSLDTGRSIMQIDIMAIAFNDLKEEETIIECKGGGNASEAFNFMGKVTKLRAEKSIFVCNHPKDDEVAIRDACEGSGTEFKLLEELLVDYESDNEYKRIVDSWYHALSISNSLLSNESLCRALNIPTLKGSVYHRSYQNILKLKQTRLNLARIFGKSALKRFQNIELIISAHKGFPLHCARLAGVDCRKIDDALVKSAIADPAASEVLNLRIEWIADALRVAYLFKNSNDKSILVGISNDHKDLIKIICENMSLYSKLPYFFQVWAILYGGLIKIDSDIPLIAKMIGESVENVELLIAYINSFFSVQILGKREGYLIRKVSNFYKIEHVSNAIRGCSISFRKDMGFSTQGIYHGRSWEGRYHSYI